MSNGYKYLLLYLYDQLDVGRGRRRILRLLWVAYIVVVIFVVSIDAFSFSAYGGSDYWEGYYYNAFPYSFSDFIPLALEALAPLGLPGLFLILLTYLNERGIYKVKHQLRTWQDWLIDENSPEVAGSFKDNKINWHGMLVGDDGELLNDADDDYRNTPPLRNRR